VRLLNRTTRRISLTPEGETYLTEGTRVLADLDALERAVSGAKALPNGVSLIDVYAQSGLVPECAMRVSRDADGGAVFRSRPSSPCACLFEQKATGSTDCTACKVQGDCAAGETCSQGYCEKP